MYAYVPIASMYCDADGYVSLKEEPSANAGSCVYFGRNVTIGTFDAVVSSPELRTYWDSVNARGFH